MKKKDFRRKRKGEKIEKKESDRKRKTERKELDKDKVDNNCKEREREIRTNDFINFSFLGFMAYKRVSPFSFCLITVL